MFRTVFVSFCALAILTIASVRAEDAEVWRYQCLGDEVIGSKICTTELATFENGEEFVVYFVHTDTGVPPLIVAGEDEALISATIKVDKNDPLSSESCDSGACLFSTEHSDMLLAQFRKGFRANVIVRAADQKIVFDRQLSLRGFSAALIAPPD